MLRGSWQFVQGEWLRIGWWWLMMLHDGWLGKPPSCWRFRDHHLTSCMYPLYPIMTTGYCQVLSYHNPWLYPCIYIYIHLYTHVNSHQWNYSPTWNGAINRDGAWWFPQLSCSVMSFWHCSISPFCKHRSHGLMHQMRSVFLSTRDYTSI